MSRRVGLIGGGAAFVVLVLWFLFLWRPQQSEASDARSRTEAAEQQASDLRVRLNHLRSLQDKEVLTRSQLDALRVAVPDQPNLAQFILDANRAATASGLEFLSVTPAQPEPGTGGRPAAIRVSLSLTGGYFAVLDFVSRLEHLRRIVVVDTMNLSPAPAAQVAAGTPPARDRLAMALQARIFVTPSGVSGRSATPPPARPAAPPVPGASSTPPTAPSITLSEQG